MRPRSSPSRRRILRGEKLERRFLLASISGVYFADEDRNGVLDEGESAISDATVFLRDANRTIRQQVDTDIEGRFRFDDLAEDTYFLRVFPPDGTRLSSPLELGREIESIASATPLDVGSGFLDGDAQPEVFLLEIAEDGPQVSILRDADDDLQELITVDVPSDPAAMTVADLNNDGLSDIATTHGNGVVAVSLNNGQNDFLPAVNYPVGSLPRGLVAADFDQDGDQDLAVVSNGDSIVTLLRNDGDGGFVTAGTRDAGPGPASIVASDIDGDQRLDLVIGNLGTPQDGGGFTLLNNTTPDGGSLDFSQPLSVDLDESVFDVVADRFFDTNQDGVVSAVDGAQILVGRFEGITPTMTVYDADSLNVLREFDLREMGDAPALKNGTVGEIHTGDFDSDGDLDVVLAATNRKDVVYFANQNQRHFTERIMGGLFGQFTTTPKAVVTSLDVDLDGDLDFVVAHGADGVLIQSSRATLLRTVLIPPFEVRLTLESVNESIDNVDIAVEPTPLVVTSLGDGSDADLSDGVARAADGTATLRAAIEQANANSDLSIIEFDLPGLGPHIISPSSEYPALQGRLVLDGNRGAEFQQIGIDGGNALSQALTSVSDAGVFIDGITFANFTAAGLTIQESDPLTTVVQLQPGSVEIRNADNRVYRSHPAGSGPLRLLDAGGDSLELDASQITVQGVVTSERGSATEALRRRLRLEGPDQTLDLRTMNGNAFRGIDIIDLTAADSSRLVVTPSSLQSLGPGKLNAADPDSERVLRIESMTEDQIEVIGSGFEFDRVDLQDGRLVHSFRQGDTTVVFDGPTDWTNPVDPLDVNRNQMVSASDALVVINELSRRRFSTSNGEFIDLESVDLNAFLFYDASRDHRLTALDALRVINELGRQDNGSEAEGESTFAPPASQAISAASAIDAYWSQSDSMARSERRATQEATWVISHQPLSSSVVVETEPSDPSEIRPGMESADAYFAGHDEITSDVPNRHFVRNTGLLTSSTIRSANFRSF